MWPNGLGLNAGNVLASIYGPNGARNGIAPAFQRIRKDRYCPSAATSSFLKASTLCTTCSTSTRKSCYFHAATPSNQDMIELTKTFAIPCPRLPRAGHTDAVTMDMKASCLQPGDYGGDKGSRLQRVVSDPQHISYFFAWDKFGEEDGDGFSLLLNRRHRPQRRLSNGFRQSQGLLVR